MTNRRLPYYAPAAIGMGAGEDACTLGMLCISTSPPELLTSLLGSCGPPPTPYSLLLLVLLVLPLLLISLPPLLGVPATADDAPTGTPFAPSGVVTSAGSTGMGFGGAVQRGISHSTPVKVLRRKPPRFHLRQGLPERSRARSPALMAPWFALGPSRWVLPRMGSRVPSSL